MQEPSLFVAFIAGLISFLSPCVFPLIPVYIGYLSGAALATARGGSSGAVAGSSGGAATATMSSTSARWIVMAHALVFMLGFTFIFGVVIGGLAGSLSFALKEKVDVLQRIMGVVLLVFGLHMIGLINIRWLDYTRRLDIRPSSNLGYLRSLLVGMAFAIGWTPCTSVQLGLIFTLALNGEPGKAWVPFLVYSLGLGVPFLVAAMAMGQVSGFLKKLMRRTYSLKIGRWTAIDQVNIVSLVSGAVLIIMSLLILTNSLTLLTSLFPTIDLPNNL